MGIVLLVVALISLLLLAFQYKPVQTWAAKKAAAYLSDELNTKIGIKSLYIKPFTTVTLEGFYVLDRDHDTLLNAPMLDVEVTRFTIFNSLKKRYLNISSIELNNASVYLKTRKDSTSNLKFILDYFTTGGDSVRVKPKAPGKPWTVDFHHVAVNNMRLRYKNMLRDSFVRGINFNDLDVKSFNAVLNDLDVKNHLFKAEIEKLSLREKSGFKVNNLSALATIDTNQILLQKLSLITPHSKLGDYLLLSFSGFDDLNDFEHLVKMDGSFKKAHLSSADIKFFTSSLAKTKFELGINGRIQGKVNNLRAKNLTVTAGKSTYIKGDFNVRGLPDWDNTFLNLQFEQVATNKKDLDVLSAQFTGASKSLIPDVIGKFGNINFKGNFAGVQNDFVAYGSFKTNLGRFDTDLNLKIGKGGTPSYSGKIATNQFNLGKLINDATIGRTTFTANVKGQGDNFKTMNVKGNARIRSIAYNNYVYNNIDFTGGLNRKVINGIVKINDRNLNLNLAANINLNPKLPVFDIDGVIKNARLDALQFIKDTVSISTTLRTNFSGDNIDNISGHIYLSKTGISTPTAHYLIDSVYLSATGTGRERLLQFESDPANGSIRGNYNLATLPDYFKSIVKKYIPSLQTPVQPHKPQDFEFSFKLKNINPLLAVFMPAVQIPDGGNLVGRFNSADSTATLGGYIKTIQYNKMVLHDLIVDESTAPQYLNANLSLNRVDLTDSLFIKDVNITNFLSKDSLNFNIKLSDKNAANQLDLYGLVEFGRDTTAKLKLLPSEVVLDNEKWRLEEQVRIRLLDNKTQVSGFALSNGEQKISIDGFLSNNNDDKMNVVFDKFRMSTLNSLTKPYGVNLHGALNGKIILSSLTKDLNANADLQIDTMMMNNTEIGTVKIVSDFDNEYKKAIAHLNIMNHGLETMDIEGAYSFAADAKNPLDFEVNMNQTEVIIFTPFVHNLVSDLKGTISTNLKLTGTLESPDLNGDISLNNTGLTVNYLKTPYTLSDKLQVENSVIKIEDLILKDQKNGKGTANGSVDLNNIANPTIDITIEADNLLALNTTFKDNHLYYGTAYGSGSFSFRGPIDNMQIDIRATTGEGTVFNIPLNTSSTAGDYDFVHYVSLTDTAKVVEKPRSFNGVTLNFDLTADERTLVKISTDYGQLEGRGTTRNLKLNINSLGDFEMFGDFLISTGEFEFTAKNFISKNFEVNQGGTIRWTGNPNNAEINLNAIYEVRTNIAPLYTAAGFTSPRGNQQVLVQAELILTKSLLQPSIDFDFTFPNDPSIKEDVSTYLADNNNRSQQALSIIVRRNFNAGSAGGNLNEQVINTATDAVTEFAFNQLNSLIAQSNIKNVDINIRSQNEASASVHLFSDRLTLTGSLYSNTGSNNLFFNNEGTLFNSTDRRGDFEALYRIRKDGNLTARFSRRILSGTTLNPVDALYINGIGLIYQRDFDSFGEFFRNIFRQGGTRRVVTPNPVPKTTPNPTPAANYKPQENNNEEED